MKTSETSSLVEIGVSCSIAARIVELHQAGFKFNFDILAGYQVFCTRENRFISLKDLSDEVVSQCFQQLSQCNKLNKP